jgi:hypothetical protein
MSTTKSNDAGAKRHQPENCLLMGTSVTEREEDRLESASGAEVGPSSLRKSCSLAIH